MSDHRGVVQNYNMELERRAAKRWRTSVRGVRMAEVDGTMPSKKYGALVAELPRRHANLLMQFRTNHVPLQSYLERIGKAPSAMCPTCGRRRPRDCTPLPSRLPDLRPPPRRPLHVTRLLRPHTRHAAQQQGRPPPALHIRQCDRPSANGRRRASRPPLRIPRQRHRRRHLMPPQARHLPIPIPRCLVPARFGPLSLPSPPLL